MTKNDTYVLSNTYWFHNIGAEAENERSNIADFDMGTAINC